MTNVRIRPEEPGDESAIRSVDLHAFDGPLEADLVDRLRHDGDLVLSLIAESGGIVGHLAFARLFADDPSLRAVALAPLAVTPSHQCKGIGGALVRDGLERLGAAGEHFVLVLGDPAYYARFGFAAGAARPVSTPYDGPYLQALALAEPGKRAAGSLHYPRAFDGLA